MNLKPLVALLFACVTLANATADVFSQAGPGTFDSTTPLISQVNFSDDELLVALEVKISELDYNWAGDLALSLTSPLGSKIDLVNRLGKSDFTSTTDSGNSSDYRGDYTFSDNGVSLVEAATDGVLPTGHYFATTASGQVESLVDTFRNEATLGTWTLLIEDFDEEDSGAISGWSITTKSVADPECDFNLDGMCDILDLDGPAGLYTVGDLEQGVDAMVNSQYDIVSDGRIDSLDLNLWLGAAAHRHGFAQGYRKGDYDLNGTVEFSDFLRLSSGFGSGQLWGDGNSRGTGETGFRDFLVMSENFGGTLIQKMPPAANLPEPATASILLGLIAGIYSLRTGRRRSSQRVTLNEIGLVTGR